MTLAQPDLIVKSPARAAVRRRGALRRLVCWAIMGAVAAASPVLAAGPIDVSSVGAGAATFEQHGNQMTIHAADRTIINYRRFDVPQNLSVQFVQPAATARVLNRIASGSPSHIDGAVSANGIVYFMNPAGVIFGPNSVINVNQIFAGAGTITDKDFLSNINHFTANAGQVLNYGRIEANAVNLIGARVANFGSIVAPQGMVTMVSGSDVYLGEQGGHILVKLSGEAAQTADAPSVEQSGTISAPGGTVILASKDRAIFMVWPRSRRCTVAKPPRPTSASMPAPAALKSAARFMLAASAIMPRPAARST